MDKMEEAHPMTEIDKEEARVIAKGLAPDRLHYFDQAEADASDFLLGMAKMQGYVPEKCLLGGAVVMAEVTASRNPCWGCSGPRDRCGGKPEQQEADRGE